MPAPGSAVAICGDGVRRRDVQPEDPSFEECDDANEVVGDGCSDRCLVERCGNGRLDHGEGCDDGNRANTGACTNACEAARCGDGVRQLGEEGCDDGNQEVGDGCDAQCRLEGCGNGRVDPGEGCDDGNREAGDGCNLACQVEACGNARRDLGEECDDGNQVDTDACLTSCALARCGDGRVHEGRGPAMTATGSIRTRAPMTVNRRAAATASRAVIERQERTALKPAMTATKTLEMAAIGSVAERSAVTGGSTKEKPVMMATASRPDVHQRLFRRHAAVTGSAGKTSSRVKRATRLAMMATPIRPRVPERLRRGALRRRAGTIRGGSL